MRAARAQIPPLGGGDVLDIDPDVLRADAGNGTHLVCNILDEAGLGIRATAGADQPMYEEMRRPVGLAADVMLLRRQCDKYHLREKARRSGSLMMRLGNGRRDFSLLGRRQSDVRCRNRISRHLSLRFDRFLD